MARKEAEDLAVIGWHDVPVLLRRMANRIEELEREHDALMETLPEWVELSKSQREALAEGFTIGCLTCGQPDFVLNDDDCWDCSERAEQEHADQKRDAQRDHGAEG